MILLDSCDMRNPYRVTKPSSENDYNVPVWNLRMRVIKYSPLADGIACIDLRLRRIVVAI